MPLKVRLERAEADDGDDDGTAAEKLRTEALREAFTVTELRDGNNDDAPLEMVTLRLHTMGFDDEYWLDSGSFKI
jgi:hypothetical protein